MADSISWPPFSPNFCFKRSYEKCGDKHKREVLEEQTRDIKHEYEGLEEQIRSIKHECEGLDEQIRDIRHECEGLEEQITVASFDTAQGFSFGGFEI